MSEAWDTSSLRRAGSKLGRPSSILSRTSHSRRSSVSTQPPNDRIMTWRQGISHSSFDSTNSSLPRRSASPRKSLARLSMTSVRHPDSPSLRPTQTNDTLDSMPAGTSTASMSMEHTPSQSVTHSETSTPSRMLHPERTNSSGYSNHLASAQNPMAVHNGQSWMFWATRNKKMQPGHEDNRPTLDARTSGISQLSKLTDELSAQGHQSEDGECQYCGSEEFAVKFVGEKKVLACGSCGRTVDESVDKAKEENQNAYSRFYT
jgi:hypothetical protein